MKNLLSRPLWRIFIICIPLWFVFSNFLLAAISAILFSFLVGMIMEIYRAGQRKKHMAHAPSSLNLRFAHYEIPALPYCSYRSAST